MRKLAVLDDDESFRDFLKTFFSLHGYSVHAFATAGTFLDAAHRLKPDAIILDVHLPGFDGLGLLKTLREAPEFKRLPIILVSGRYRKPAEVVKGLEQGGDDYFVKPLEAEVLLARIEALLRRHAWRAEDEPPAELRLGALVVSPSSYTARLGTQDLKLARREFEFLVYLLEHPDRVHSRAHLLASVWKESVSLQGRTIDKYVESLRKKLGPLGERLRTIVGVGYLLKTK